MTGYIPASNDELHTVRDAMRGLNRLVDDMAAGRVEKAVLTRHGQMVAVVLPVDVYASYLSRLATP